MLPSKNNTVERQLKALYIDYLYNTLQHTRLTYSVIFLTGLGYDLKQDLIYLKENCKVVMVY